MPRHVVAIGNFDGVHVGHRAILSRAAAHGRDAGVPVVAITFDPHPATILRPGAQPPKLCTIERRVALLRAAGADDVLVIEPTREFLGETPEQFVAWLVERYAPTAVVEGPDFRFGRGRRGDVATLAEHGRRLGPRGFEVEVVPAVSVALSDQLVAPVSSSLARWLLGYGRAADATRCLGRPHAIAGEVVRGERRGRAIGVPTANLDPAAFPDLLLPAPGVYAGYAEIAGGTRHAAAISVGVKPTFGQTRPLAEAHLLGFAGDLYGQRLTLRFTRWLRDQQPFPGVDALKAQLARDLALTRRWHEQGLLDTLPPAHAAS